MIFLKKIIKLTLQLFTWLYVLFCLPLLFLPIIKLIEIKDIAWLIVFIIMLLQFAIGLFILHLLGAFNPFTKFCRKFQKKATSKKTIAYGKQKNLETNYEFIHASKEPDATLELPDTPMSFDDIFEYKSVSFKIAGKYYDIMKQDEVEKIPCLPIHAYVLGETYGIDYILRKNAIHIYNANGDYALAGACIRKSNELFNAGYGTKGDDELAKEKLADERRRKKEQDILRMKKINDSVTVEDMHKLPDLPFELRWVLNMQHTNGRAWFPLNMNNQFVALSLINYINKVFQQARNYLPNDLNLYVCTENICFDYISPVYLDSLPATFVECIPYTLTRKISKYPMVLHFVEIEGDLIYENVLSTGSIYLLQDGNIGKADIVIGDLDVRLRLIGTNLIVQRVLKHVDERYNQLYYYE